MLELAKEIPLCLVLAGVLGLYIGYLLAKESCNSTEIPAEHH